MLRQPGIFLGIGHIHPGTEYGDGLAFCGNGAAVRCGVDSARHAANDDEPASRQVNGEPLGHARSVRRGMSRAHHGNAGLREHIRVATDVEHDGGIIDFLQSRRVRCVVEGNNCDPGGGSLG